MALSLCGAFGGLGLAAPRGGLAGTRVEAPGSVRASVRPAFLTPTLMSASKSKSPIQRMRLNEKQREINQSQRSAVRTSIKKTLAAVEAYQAAPSPEGVKAVYADMSQAFSRIDKCIKKGQMHKNAGANQKRRLTSALARAKAAEGR